MAKKEKKTPPKKKGGSVKAKLDKGGAEIRKLKAEAAKVEPLVLKPLDRSVEEIVRDRVTVLEGSLGIALSQDTTIEESLAILGYTTQMSDHVAFWIGDVLNFSNAKWGDKYTQALHQTNKALSTLKGYSEASRRIPADKRQAALTFSQHREILRLDDKKMVEVLEEVGAQAKDGEAPTVAELRVKIQKLTPRKKAAPKKVTSGKGKKGKAKPEAPPYQPTKEEQDKLDEVEMALSEAADGVKSAKLFQLVSKLDNKEKKRWLEIVHPIVLFYTNLDRATGY